MTREKSRLPPSPQSRHAKKPLISVETARTYSLDRMKKQEKPMNSFQSLSKVYAHSSQKQNESPNVFCLHTNNSIFDKEKQQSPKCINHGQRKAIAMSWKNTPVYYCFECSLYQARRGIKIIQIKTQAEQQSQPSIPINPRTKTLQNYIHQSNKLQTTLTTMITSLKSLLSTYTNKFSQLIEQQQHEMQTIIKSIEQQTNAKIKQIQRKSAQQNEIIMKHCEQIMCVKSVVKLNRLDVLKNYQDCVHGFGEAQFRQVMGSYWRQIEDYGREFGEGVVERVGVQFEVGYKEMMDFVGIRNWKDFTFSKQYLYQSPKCYQQLQGVPITSSNHYTTQHNKTYHINQTRAYPNRN